MEKDSYEDKKAVRELNGRLMSALWRTVQRRGKVEEVRYDSKYGTKERRRSNGETKARTEWFTTEDLRMKRTADRTRYTEMSKRMWDTFHEIKVYEDKRRNECEEVLEAVEPLRDERMEVQRGFNKQMDQRKRQASTEWPEGWDMEDVKERVDRRNLHIEHRKELSETRKDGIAFFNNRLWDRHEWGEPVDAQEMEPFQRSRTSVILAIYKGIETDRWKYSDPVHTDSGYWDEQHFGSSFVDYYNSKRMDQERAKNDRGMKKWVYDFYPQAQLFQLYGKYRLLHLQETREERSHRARYHEKIDMCHEKMDRRKEKR